MVELHKATWMLGCEKGDHRVLAAIEQEKTLCKLIYESDYSKDSTVQVAFAKP